MSNRLEIKCNKECDIEFWTDDDADTASLSIPDFKEKSNINNHNKKYNFKENKEFMLNLTKSQSNKLKYKTSEDSTVKEYTIVNSKRENSDATSAAKPAAKTAAKPVAKPAAKPAAKPVAKPAAESNEVKVNYVYVFDVNDKNKINRKGQIIKTVTIKKSNENTITIMLSRANAYEVSLDKQKNILTPLDCPLVIKDIPSKSLPDFEKYNKYGYTIQLENVKSMSKTAINVKPYFLFNDKQQYRNFGTLFRQEGDADDEEDDDEDDDDDNDNDDDVDADDDDDDDEDDEDEDEFFDAENSFNSNVPNVQLSAKNSCTAISNYSNRGKFSCYYDSLFFALFAFKSTFIEDELFRKRDSVEEKTFEIISQYLRRVSSFDKEGDYCLLIPNELLIDPDYPNAQEDAGELLHKILETLGITTLTEEITETRKKKSDSTVERIVTSSSVIPIIEIGNQEISISENFFIKKNIEGDTYISQKHIDSKTQKLKNQRQAIYDSYDGKQQIQALAAFNAVNLPQKEHSKFTYFIEKTWKYNFKDQQFIVFKNVEVLENKDIDIITALVNGSNQNVFLNQIVCRAGAVTAIGGKSGHYVCYFRCNQNWYLYNDLEQQTINLIGSKLKIQDGYTWTLLFYNEVNPIKPQA